MSPDYTFVFTNDSGAHLISGRWHAKRSFDIEMYPLK
jgi:hypothetical protein